MKSFVTAGFIVLIFSCSIFADLRYISREESVKESDFIVIGTLQSLSDISGNELSFDNEGQGILVIDEIVAGNVFTAEGLPLKSSNKLRLEWSEPSPCLMGWHKRTENKKGVWLLKVNVKGAVVTSHPAQFADFDEFSEIKKYIKKYSGKFSKTITIQIGESQNSIYQRDVEIPKANVSEISTLPMTTEYYPFQAALIILASFSLYYLLYRSRFKIR
jgi:hypothetical protein